ncbi:MAG: GNAT family N-acetyltransferase [Pseudomonadota bacterium]|jgi:ribosomal-protein-alanine N-acetyltransferase|uniref:GNAT family N-acetyltransferase n=1 Tax=Burkholderiaceae TaxID=119060 RepID=UPI0010F7720E|nr:GNAT family N-acetyltransferase [Burkholderia sp. 4M9327F10]
MNEPLLQLALPATARLQLRPLDVSDTQRIFEIWSDPEVMRFYDLAPLTRFEQAEQVVARLLQDTAERTGLRWAIVAKADSRVIGTCGLRLNFAFRSASLGFELERRCWRQGLMREALDAALGYAFEHLGMNRIQATTDLDNDASAGLLKRLGFVEEGVMRQWGYWKDAFHDVRLFALIKEDREAWLAARDIPHTPPAR